MLRQGRHSIEALAPDFIAKARGEIFHDAQRVVPQRLNLHRLADARRHYPVADFGVHPGELHARFAGSQQPVAFFHVDAVARSLHVPLDDLQQHRIKLPGNGQVGCGFGVGAYSFEIPERGIHRVVLRRFARIRKAIRQHALADVLGKFQQDAAGNVVPARRQGQPGKRDHGVASPIAEPGITGNHRLLLAARHDELVGRNHQSAGEIVVRWRRLGHFSPPGDLAFLQRRGFIRLAYNIGRGNHYCRRLACKRELQHTRVE